MVCMHIPTTSYSCIQCPLIYSYSLRATQAGSILQADEQTPPHEYRFGVQAALARGLILVYNNRYSTLAWFATSHSQHPSYSTITSACLWSSGNMFWHPLLRTKTPCTSFTHPSSIRPSDESLTDYLQPPMTILE